MSVTLVSDLSDQAQKFWSPMLKDELFETNILATLVNKDFEGDLKRGGDTVYVSMIEHPTAERKTIGSVGADVFSSQKMTTQRVGIVADQRITASFELEDLVDLQTQLGDPMGQSKMRQVLVEALSKSLNSYLYSLVAPSSSAPDHILNAVTNFDAAQLLAVRRLASASHWPKGERWLLLDPSYYNDILAATTLTSSDYVPDQATVAGQIVSQRFGFNILEDDSDGILTLGTSGADCGLAFHPDFLYLVMGAPQVKVSDLHSNKQHGYLVSVDMWCGAKLGLEGAVKHIKTFNT